MVRRRLTSKERLVALHAIEERPVGESIAQMCSRLAISRASYYRWKDRGRSKDFHRRPARRKRPLPASQQQQVLLAIVRTMSRVERRQAAVWVQARFGVSTRQVKKTFGVSPHPRPTPSDKDRVVADRMLELARQHPDFGYRRLAILLRDEGVVINHKRAARIWRELAKKVGSAHRRRRPRKPVVRPSPLASPWPRYCWSLDMTAYRTNDYRRLEFLTILDDFSRLCLALHAARAIKLADMREVLQRLFISIGPPRYLRVDRQAAAMLRPLTGLLTEHFVAVRVTRGKTPAENAYIESFHATLATGFCGIYSFQNVRHAQALADKWRTYYNERRPHSSLNYQTPQQFAETSSELLADE